MQKYVCESKYVCKNVSKPEVNTTAISDHKGISIKFKLIMSLHSYTKKYRKINFITVNVMKAVLTNKICKKYIEKEKINTIHL